MRKSFSPLPSFPFPFPPSSLFLSLDSGKGAVFTWGCGDHGQLGHNDTRDRLEPCQVQDLVGTKITQMVVGEAHMLALGSK